MKKGQVLINIRSHLTKFIVPDLFCFVAIDYEHNSKKITKKIKKLFENKIVIIRSSASDEDGDLAAAAGEYDSVGEVNPNNSKELSEAIAQVIKSYQKKRNLKNDDEIIVQEMVQNVSMSGVVFTYDLNTGAPYYVVNYDSVSGLTNTVTSGDGIHSNRTLFIQRDSIASLRSERFSILLVAIKELEKVMKSKFLDIEFAMGVDSTPYLFQVRRITTLPNWNKKIESQVNKTLKDIHADLNQRFTYMKGVYGKTTVFGQMPDWNPVEMIGRAPRALASSLYKLLITDEVWSNARSKMGYSSTNGIPLMISLAGQPFVDSRLSFHSFIPKKVPSLIAEKLVNKWISSFKLAPEFHDKVEFDIAITAYSFDIDEKIEDLIGDALSKQEKVIYKKELFEMTKELVNIEKDSSLNKALEKISNLHDLHLSQKNTYLLKDFNSIRQMINDCIEYGTTPFSILARHGFIARTLLLSLKNIGIISAAELNEIQGSIKTIATELLEDIVAVKNTKQSKENFLLKYGHLRPGTYDIMSKRYDQMDRLFDSSLSKNTLVKKKKFRLSSSQEVQINNLLKDHGFIDLNAKSLLQYINESTVSREYSKFVFTRSVSEILETIANFGEKIGLSRNDLSHIPIKTLLQSFDSVDKNQINSVLKEVATYEEKKHEVSVAIRLPQVLIDKDGLYVIPFQVSHPNFITNKQITASRIVIDSSNFNGTLNGKIVVIEGADPGYDWIFSHKIAGLITKYGGANSHMAIRCAEFLIPAAIGCGERQFELILEYDNVHLDCAAGLLTYVH